MNESGLPRKQEQRSLVTLADVGKRAGYSRGLATHHFGSKGAMMQRLVDTVTDIPKQAQATA
jgi:AcrR family transcriptional regulator